jgi:predicted transcriptional regulator
MSKLDKLEQYLQSGAVVTSQDIEKVFGLKNPTSAIYTLRSRGVCVYTNKIERADGTVTTKYRVGKPTKNMIAALHAIGAFA